MRHVSCTGTGLRSSKRAIPCLGLDFSCSLSTKSTYKSRRSTSFFEAYYSSNPAFTFVVRGPNVLNPLTDRIFSILTSTCLTSRSTVVTFLRCCSSQASAGLPSRFAVYAPTETILDCPALPCRARRGWLGHGLR